MDNLNKAVIYKDAEDVVQVGFAASNAYPIDEMASVIVPEGSPFLIVTRDDLPTPPYHNAIVPDFSKPDGVSIGADKIRAKWAADKAAADAEITKQIQEAAKKSADESFAQAKAEIKAREEQIEAERKAREAQATANDSVEGT